jgi:hypothetical protein
MASCAPTGAIGDLGPFTEARTLRIQYHWRFALPSKMLLSNLLQ